MPIWSNGNAIESAAAGKRSPRKFLHGPRSLCGFKLKNGILHQQSSFLSAKVCIILLEQMRRHGWKIAFALNTGGIPGNGEQDGLNGDDADLSRTRLGRIVSAGGRQLLQKLNSARRNFPMKIFLLLLGFYTANALATILGQTGDWDVLVAGVVVAAIEGIGMLMYRKPPSLSSRRLQSFVTMMNYWKSGICLGLFVDAFKLGS
ncbi:ycf20-like protein isoform X2 [Rhodamnia argentea]|uniref:Ycf20-like protein isoform X2 n=1 Tax=Rhodamnia argentea TaxID=178133 RepID=A0A8B8Q152_9MYRT|nr:ycf20-like protein isoform X2 [Rhodamnia argentea]XP_030540780.1 ycf20-like protein isoform X2 [Rhodamnia argentea]XP_048136949.1 ycf20-like protein isoform X2 [Rhodamnia argentea]